MTPMTPLRQRMTQDMQIRNLSPRTIECYTYHVGCFAKHFGRSPDQLGMEQVRAYQVYLVQEKKASWSSFNQAVCALRFLYGVTLGQRWPVVQIPFAKRPKKLPVVLGPEEVQRLLPCVRPLKPRVLLTTIYAAGLRLEEATHLELRDIDSARMLLRVACGKGAKERLVPLSPRLLDELRGYWKVVRPARWLFPGGALDRPIAPTTVQKSCKRAAREAGIAKLVTPHTLRHSYATGLLEAGVDLLTISRLLEGKLSPLRTKRTFESWLATLYAKKWVAYVQGPPSGVSGAEAVLKYLARYVSGVAISDRRLVSHANGHVTFRWKNYARGGTSATTPPLPGLEFVRRYMLHVLPRGFVRIRSYGLLSNRSRKSDLARCRALLAAPCAASPCAASPVVAPSTPVTPVAPAASTRDAAPCATCSRGRLVLRESWPRPTVWELVARQSSSLRPRAARSAPRPALDRPAPRPAVDRPIVAKRSSAAAVQDTS